MRHVGGMALCSGCAPGCVPPATASQCSRRGTDCRIVIIATCMEKPGEDVRRFGGIEALDLVPPPFAADFVDGRFQPAGDEFLEEAWGAHKPIMNDEL